MMDTNTCTNCLCYTCTWNKIDTKTPEAVDFCPVPCKASIPCDFPVAHCEDYKEGGIPGIGKYEKEPII